MVAGSSRHFKDPWQEQRLFLSRVIAAGVIVLLLSGVLVTRLVQLQIWNYERFIELTHEVCGEIMPGAYAPVHAVA